ncbi:DHH family phosphoesterase [Sediminitomix flava]|uniref:Phosphoesterase RecJ-like protein n=1 Tax=Sediminitomix flava TaxID=379075 RepID=A0A315Z5U7_SEDFL|nr:bifunctional oligoribonuclease/PAP phosphatase NrnA [Sediminitomix flava]PWJ39227.1 phosphoesterase RecJ-like protein [Sediminitomix flava]
MYNFKDLQQYLATPRKAVILPHQKPDADALGSCLALASYLGKAGHNTTVISPNDYPTFLNWMEGHDKVVVYDNGNEEKSAKIIGEADIIFCLDFSSLNRVDKMENLVKAQLGKKKFVVIDHHQGKEDFADFELWDISAAATAQLIYEFILMDEGSHKIDIPMAANIYAGIMTDTGSFKYPGTSSRTHRIAADLKDLGLDTAKIHNLVYDNNSENRIKFLGFALNQRLTILRPLKAAYFAITEKDQQRFNTQTGDSEGVVNYALSIEGIRIAAFFKEQEGNVKISFRSIGDFSVAELAANYFNGGGHKNAAGGILRNSNLDIAIQTFEEALSSMLSVKIENQ